MNLKDLASVSYKYGSTEMKFFPYPVKNKSNCLFFRWKLRQRKAEMLPTTTALTSTASRLSSSHLYGMSYPLTQFASDTLTKTQNLRLRVNLVTLLLTGLADVVIFGEVEAIVQLLHHHKVLYKCLEIAQQDLATLEDQDPLSDLRVRLVAALLRVFRVTLQKHANHRRLRDPRKDVASRTHQEELVKHVCGFFSRGLAHLVITSYFSETINSWTLASGTPPALVSSIFEEIGSIVKMIGLCSHGSSVGSRVTRVEEASYLYLRETRDSLANLMNEMLRMAPEIGKIMPEVVNKSIVSCLATTVCLSPCSAVSTAMGLLLYVPDRQKLFDCLEASLAHFYSRHGPQDDKWPPASSENSSGKGPSLPCLVDSDSAICATSDSSLTDLGVASGRTGAHFPETEKIQKYIWVPYLEFLLRHQYPDITKDVQYHLNRLIGRLGSIGRTHLVIGLVLPLIEAISSNVNIQDDKETEELGPSVWAMKALALAYQNGCYLPEYFRQQPERCRGLLDKFLTICLQNFNSQMGFDSFLCLVALAEGELNLVLINQVICFL